MFDQSVDAGSRGFALALMRADRVAGEHAGFIWRPIGIYSHIQIFGRFKGGTRLQSLVWMDRQWGL